MSFKVPKFNEQMLENRMIKKLEKLGWKFVPASELERESYPEPLVISTLTRILSELNSDKNITDSEIKKVLNELKLKGTGAEGSRKILEFLKSGIAVKFEKDRQVKYVRIFDYDNIAENEFTASRQNIYQNRKEEEIRTDIMLYVNGIPLVNIELKNPTSFSQGWYNAFEDIKYYEKMVPELYKYVQIGMAAAEKTRYFPVVPWQDIENIKNQEWREKDITDPIDSGLAMLKPSKLLDIVKHYLFIREEFGETTKVIARFLQYRASEKMVTRAANWAEGKSQKNRGLIWHWQGSGKTLTMIFAANKLYQMRKLENPTVFFIVDRIELEDQLYQEFEHLDITEPEIIGSINELQKILRHDQWKGKRGLMITLIHKFRVSELQELYKKLQAKSHKKKTISTRKNVITFIDEGHRTQYGTMASTMQSILNNSCHFALTGTPISKKGRNTYNEFSYLPEEKYLDKYFISDSIKDGFTLKIAYQPRFEKKFHLRKQLLKNCLETDFEEISSDRVREEVEKGVKYKLNAVKAFLENEKRIGKIAQDMSEDFKENLDDKFKALVVAASRKACVLYKRELDRHLPENYSEVVMSYDLKKDKTKKDRKIISDFLKEFRERYRGKDIEDINKELKDDFKEEPYPKILIVTNMLLAGYDAPVLQTMYLDKPLREHRLLQAIARTNRPFRGVKEAGLIIDYVGILDEFKSALDNYTKEEIRNIIVNMGTLRDEFNSILKELLLIFKDLRKEEYTGNVLLKATEILTSDEKLRKKFTEEYRKLRKLYELLGSDKIKLERFSEFKWLSAIYTYYSRMALRNQKSYTGLIEKYFNRTIRYVHRTTDIQNIEKDLPVLTVDENFLTNLGKRVKTKGEKAASVVFALNRLVLVDRHNDPIYESVSDKVERLMNAWKSTTKDYEELYQEGAGILRKINAGKNQRKSLGLDRMEHSFLLSLQNEFGKDENRFTKDATELSHEINQHLFPGWENQTTARKKVERKVRRFIRRYVRRYGKNMSQLDELYKKLFRNVEDYGKKNNP